jgi:hypothetical protein
VSTLDILERVYARHGRPARFYPSNGDFPFDVQVRFEYAAVGRVDHGNQEKALVKVLWPKFPTMPDGEFLVDGVKWKVLEPAGKVDGHLEGVQRVMLCGANRALSVER